MGHERDVTACNYPLRRDDGPDVAGPVFRRALRGLFRGRVKRASEVVVDLDNLIGAGDGEYPHDPWRSDDKPQSASGGGGLPAGDHDGYPARRIAERSRSYVDDPCRRQLAERR